MSNRTLRTAEAAWDAAEKVFDDLGIDWRHTRAREHFHMETPDGRLRVAVEESGEHGWGFVVIYKPGKLFIWRCSYPPVEALTEMLGMLGYGAQSEGPAHCAFGSGDVTTHAFHTGPCCRCLECEAVRAQMDAPDGG